VADGVAAGLREVDRGEQPVGGHGGARAGRGVAGRRSGRVAHGGVVYEPVSGVLARRGKLGAGGGSDWGEGAVAAGAQAGHRLWTAALWQRRPAVAGKTASHVCGGDQLQLSWPGGSGQPGRLKVIRSGGRKWG